MMVKYAGEAGVGAARVDEERGGAARTRAR